MKLVPHVLLVWLVLGSITSVVWQDRGGGYAVALPFLAIPILFYTSQNKDERARGINFFEPTCAVIVVWIIATIIHFH